MSSKGLQDTRSVHKNQLCLYTFTKNNPKMQFKNSIYKIIKRTKISVLRNKCEIYTLNHCKITQNHCTW